MSLLALKSVIWYCKRYTQRFHVQPGGRWNLHGYLYRISDEMDASNADLRYEQALDIAVRIWTFVKWVAGTHDLANEASMERMCLSSTPHALSFSDKEKWLVREMGEMASYMDGKGSLQLDYMGRLLSLMTHTVAGAIEREAPGFFLPEAVLAKYCKDHLDSHNDETRAKMGWRELDDILCHGRWLSKDQALRFAIESWCVTQSELYANVDELEEIATRPILITDHYLSQNDAERLLDPAHHLPYSVRFGVSREPAMSFLTRSTKACADSLLLTYPEMFRTEVNE